MKKRSYYTLLFNRLCEERRFIQALLGPRQVGKTTLAHQVAKGLDCPTHYVSADLATLQSQEWIAQEWQLARQKVDPQKGAVLIIDEIQKIPEWSTRVKDLWDQDTRDGRNLRVVILGSSPWLMQKGLTESLAGRFELIHIPHWSFAEMRASFGWTLPQYLFYGGYPGAAGLIADLERWKAYIGDSLIETTLSRDILLMTKIEKPALLRRLFHLGCLYSGQILSYNKMLGQLDDKGNTTTLAHYLDLLQGVSLVAGIQKFSIQPVRQRGSSPKLQVYNTALMTAQVSLSLTEAQADHALWGHLVESAVGAYLLNSARGTRAEVLYWREGDEEVDFVVRDGEKLVAIEVKSNRDTKSGLGSFVAQFHPHKILLVGEGGMPLEVFLTTPLTEILV